MRRQCDAPAGGASIADRKSKHIKLHIGCIKAIAITEEGKLLDTNQTFAQMFCYQPSEVIGMHVSDFTPPEYRVLSHIGIHAGERFHREPRYQGDEP